MRPVRVMLSSRCDVQIKRSSKGKATTSLSKARTELKDQIEDLFRLGSRAFFEVWINEVATPAPGDETSWTYCVEQAKSCDLFIALFNGQSGWTAAGRTVGSCAAELEAALTDAPSKVSLIRLKPLHPREQEPDASLDKAFTEYVDRLNLFRGAAADAQALTALVLQTLQERVIEFTFRGARSARSAKGYQGQALDWNRMNFADRKAAIEESLTTTLRSFPGGVEVDERTVIVEVASGRVAMFCSGVPAGLALPSARELVGQPFLRDYELVAALDQRPELQGLASVLST